MTALPDPLAKTLTALLGRERFRTDPADCVVYAYDNSRRRGDAGAVAFPVDDEETAAIVRACADAGWSVVARGRGSNTTGAAVPAGGAVVVSFERMNRIEPVDRANRYVVAQARATVSGSPA